MLDGLQVFICWLLGFLTLPGLYLMGASIRWKGKKWDARPVFSMDGYSFHVFLKDQPPKPPQMAHDQKPPTRPARIITTGPQK